MITRLSLIIGIVLLCGLLATAAGAKEFVIQGRLQRTVEGNGWVILTAKEKYLLLNAAKFQNEKWFTEGTEVDAAGDVKKGAVTMYMEGTPFTVTSMKATKKADSQASSAIVQFSQAP